MQSGQISGVGQIHISVTDYDRALRFYRDVSQLPLLFEVPQQSMAFFDCAGVRIYLGIPSNPKYTANSFLYYNVDDIQAAYTKLQEKGVTFLHPPAMVHEDQQGQLWMAGFRDSEGNYAQLMQQKMLG